MQTTIFGRAAAMLLAILLILPFATKLPSIDRKTVRNAQPAANAAPAGGADAAKKARPRA